MPFDAMVESFSGTRDMKKPRAAVAISFVLSTLIVTQTVCASPDRYQAGVDAFRAGEFEVALAHFEAASEAGLQAPTLQYNLGVTHLRLGQLDGAHAAFSRIANDPEWGPLSHYNLGLIEARRGNKARAHQHFRLAHARTDSPRLRQLAAAQLGETDRTPARRLVDRSWHGSLELSSGAESNVLLTHDDAALGFDNGDDYFVEFLGTAGRYVSGHAGNGWRIDAGGYYRHYRELDDFNVGVLSFGAAHQRPHADWQLQIGANVDLQFAGGDRFATMPGLRLQAGRDLGGVRMRIRNDINYIDGSSGFEQLSGWQNRTVVDGTLRFGTSSVRAGYELELNDRDDFVEDGELLSFSPTRHRAFVGAQLPLSPSVELGTRAEYRMSRYPADNIRLGLSEAPVDKRSEDRLALTMRLAYRPGDHWRAFAEAQYVDNDANVEWYRYDNRQLTFGIEFMF
jgi:hypothetical protein